MEGYFIEKRGDEYQTVFPEAESDCSQVHESIEDALGYFKELGITFTILQLHGVQHVCPACEGKGYLTGRDNCVIHVERCDSCEMFASDLDATIHILSEVEKGV